MIAYTPNQYPGKNKSDPLLNLNLPPDPPIFSHEEWSQLLTDSIHEIEKLATLKGGEYAGDVDRLENFRRNGKLLDVPMELIWAVYYGKHHDAVMQYIRDKIKGKQRERAEPITGRIDDMIVYLLLLKAMVKEAEREV